MEEEHSRLVIKTEGESTPNIERKNTLYVKRVHPNAVLPTFTTNKSVGLHLYSVSNATIPPHSTCLISTGITVQTPIGTYGRIETVQDMVSRAIYVNSAIVDCQFTGTLMVLLSNMTKDSVVINKTIAIAQLVLQHHIPCDVVELSQTEPRVIDNDLALCS